MPHAYALRGAPSTRFADDQRLLALFGMSCHFAGEESGPDAVRGAFVLDTSLGHFEAGRLEPSGASFSEEGAMLAWSAADGALRLESTWQFCSRSGAAVRRDRLINAGVRPVTVFRCLSRFVFSPSDYAFYRQGSDWARENQGVWAKVECGAIVVACQNGRSTEAAAPYVCLRDEVQGQAIAFHLRPRGNWTMQLSATRIWGGPLPFATLDVGLGDRNLRLELAPGAVLDLPDVIVHHLPDGTPESGAPILHRHLLATVFADAKPLVPNVYNTWFDRFDRIDVERLKAQALAAKEIGLEVFVVDAGWYGRKGSWFDQAGDWQEKTDEAFEGKLGAFADWVRAQGLVFGIWMEPERIGKDALVLRVHPELFRKAEGESWFVDLARSDAYDWLFGEICRVLERYGAGWLKVDFNNAFGVDETGCEHTRYYEAWYRMMDALRRKYPNVTFEGCSGGAMRLDIESLSHFDVHFLSDNAHPVEMLRMFMGGALRLLPGRFTRWPVMKEFGGICLSPTGGGWDFPVALEPEFTLLSCLPGALGVSGDLAGLSPERRARLAHLVAVQKTWRGYTSSAVMHVLTSVRGIADKSGWAAVQLVHPSRPESLVYAYRLDDITPRKVLRLRDLDPARTYALERADTQKDPWRARMTGKELMTDGLTVELFRRFSGAMLTIVPR